MVGDRYCIAVGSGYTKVIGTKIDVVLESGKIIKCILGDAKSDQHTDLETHTYHVGGYDHGKYYPPDGSVIEFVVDSPQYNLSYVKDLFAGQILKVVVVE